MSTHTSAKVEGAARSALDAALELAERLSSVPADSPEARHPNYGLVRGLTGTIIDMLEEIAESARTSGAPTSQLRVRAPNRRA